MSRAFNSWAPSLYAMQYEVRAVGEGRRSVATERQRPQGFLKEIRSV